MGSGGPSRDFLVLVIGTHFGKLVEVSWCWAEAQSLPSRLGLEALQIPSPLSGALLAFLV